MFNNHEIKSIFLSTNNINLVYEQLKKKLGNKYLDQIKNILVKTMLNILSSEHKKDYNTSNTNVIKILNRKTVKKIVSFVTNNNKTYINNSIKYERLIKQHYLENDTLEKMTNWNN